ncbi:PLD nuclease N-terminal domain-containing protein [Streptomyces gobiensis]|uniref:PLD nuclease N-terminal domain-containing protein n=1 Tax=Streptomyces gobiensis TaxID=2875706 RepID=UPI001E52F16A|nr:PLD nuclease N-terminal domain-containing protein [Streptomyces gobiensis]UGY92939.1 PLD nuclease N-terminal domain-containing protein [Streptomyces gobiensis]
MKVLAILLLLAVWVYAFIDCLNTPENQVRKLPKVVWVIIVLLFGQVLVGPIAWFAVGRPRKNAAYGATRAEERRWVAPDDNPDFLKSIKDEDTPPPAQDGPRQEAPPPAEELSLEEWEEEFRRKDNGPDDTPPKA